MGANSPEGLEQRANTALAQSVGPPIAGKCQKLTLSAADQTLTLEGSAIYRVLAVTQAALIGLADTLQAANAEYLQVNWDRFIQTPAGGLTLHATQVAAGAILYVSKLDDVG